MIYTNLIFITILAVYVCDLSGVIESFKTALAHWVGRPVKKLPPFDCSLCMAWWANVIYLLCVGEFTLANITIVALLSFATSPIGQMLILMRETMLAIIRIIQNQIDKI